MSPDPRLGDGTSLVGAARAGELSCREIADLTLAAIDEGDDELRTFVHVGAEQLRARADELDADSEHSRTLPLLGLPVGIKDVFDTADMPTAYGSDHYVGHRPTTDAAMVARLRSCGALVVGKTATTEYAIVRPAKTRNPIDPDRTPGGSSSGSAAAVRAGFVAAATGTQTAGSTIRPGSYCGVVALKPTFGLLSRAGVKPLSETLDTVGLFTRSVDEMAMLLDALVESTRGFYLVDATDRTAGPSTLRELHGIDVGHGLRRDTDGPIALSRTSAVPPRLAYMRTDRWSELVPAGRLALDAFVADAERGGATVVEIEPPTPTAEIDEVQLTIMRFEMRQVLAPELALGGAAASDLLLDFLDSARSITVEEYLAARARADETRWNFDRVLADVDACITPSTVDVPPLGLGSTGDARFCRPWTLLGVPSLALPVVWSHDGLPFGTQLVAGHYRERELLRAGAWLENLARPTAS